MKAFSVPAKTGTAAKTKPETETYFSSLVIRVKQNPELPDTTDGLKDKSPSFIPGPWLILACEPDSRDGEPGRYGWLGARETKWNMGRGFIMHFLYNSPNTLLLFLIYPRESTTEV